jgi:hypothetical protein
VRLNTEKSTALKKNWLINDVILGLIRILKKYTRVSVNA